MITPLVLLLLTVAEPVALEARPAPDRRLLDLEADTLRPGESQFNLFGLVYARGLFPRFSLSTAIALDAVSALNLNARVQLVDESFLRVTAEVGGAYLLAGQLIKASFFWVPAEVRATVPLTEYLDLSVAMKYRLASGSLPPSAGALSFASHNISWVSTLVYHDPLGATFLELTVPAVNIARAKLSLEGVALDGTLALDNVAAWGVMIGRDQRFGRTGHLRVGVGYRHQPGILVLDSYGNLMVSLDYYWR